MMPDRPATSRRDARRAAGSLDPPDFRDLGGGVHLGQSSTAIFGFAHDLRLVEFRRPRPRSASTGRRRRPQLLSTVYLTCLLWYLQCKKCGEGGQAGAGVGAVGGAGGRFRRQVCEKFWRSPSETETLWSRAAPGVNEKKEESKGGVLRRDGGTCTALGNDTNTSLRIRRRGCYFGAELRERGAGGRK